MEEGKGVNRAALLFVLLAALVFSAPFKDVPINHWAYDAVTSVTELGIISGYPDGTFRGNEFVSRYQLAVAIYRVIEYMKRFSGTRSRGEVVSKDVLNQVNEKIEALKEFVVGYSKKTDMKIDGIGERIDKLSVDISSVSAVVSALKENVLKLSSRLDSLTDSFLASITSLKSLIDSQASEIENLKSDVSKLEVSLSKEVAGLKGSISDLGSKVGNLKGDIDSLEKGLSKTGADVKKLDSKLELLKVTLQSSLSELEVEISKLKDEGLSVKKMVKDLRDEMEAKVGRNSERIETLERNLSILSSKTVDFALKKEVTNLREDLDRSFEKTNKENRSQWVFLWLLTAALILEGAYLLYIGGVFK